MAVDDAVTLAASTNATAVDVVANDTDTESGTLTVSSPTINSGDSSGTVTTDGSVLFFTPSTGVTGTTTISYTITDDGTTSGSDAFLTDSAILTLTVNAVSNTDPVATDDTATTTEDSAQITISPLTNDTDADSDALIVASVSTAGTGTVSTDGTDVFYTPALNFNGTEVLTYIVSDSVDGIDGLDTGTITVTVTEVNDAPTTSDPANDSTDENTAVTITVTTNANYVTDVESDTLTFQNYSVSSTNSGGTDGTVALSSDGTGLVFTPSGEGQYNAVISYTLTDDGTTNGASDPQTVAGQITVTVTDVNDVPEAVADTGSMTEDDTATAFNVVTNDTDAENDSLTVSSPTINSGDTSGGLVSTDGTNITYTPSADFAGTTTIIYTLTDDGTTGGVSSPASASGLLTVTVAAVNDAPVVTDATATVAEDSSTRSYPVTTSSTYSSDVDGDTLSITAASLAGDTSGTIDVSSGTTLDYTPGADFNGTATITYTVSDATTAGNDALTDSGTLTVTVTPVADDPITSTSVTYTASTISEDATNITITLVDSASLVDSDGDQLELFSLTLNNGGSFSVNLDGSNNWDGTVTYSPAANFSGDELFTYIVTDGTTQVTSTLTVPVAAGVNDAPVTTADTEEITEDTTTATSIAVLTNDTDPEGDTISLTNVAVTTTTPTFGTGPGTVTVNGNFVDYTPAAGFVGTEVITYTVTDNDAGGGGSNPLTATGTLTVNVTNINDAPVVTDPATNTTAESTQTTLAITTGNTYVTDAESDTLTITAANISSGDTLGTVDFSDGNNILYTPSTNFNGTTVIAYTINDDGTSIVSGVTTADPLSAAGQVTVTVTADATNSAPVANSDSQTVLEDAGETIIGVLSNDTDSDSADTLSVTSVATGGTGSVRTDGTLVYYTPAANFAGTETLTYTVQDDDSANGGVGVLTASSTVIVNVLAVNDAPAPPSISPPDIASNGTTTITLFATLTDASDGDAIVLSNFVGGNGGTIVDNGDGTITYTPPADFSGDEIISFIITDSTGETTSTSITLTVVANVAPIVNSNAFSTVVENSTNNLIGILDNVTDTNTSDTLTITSISSNQSGIVTLSADGLLVTYSPAAGFDGNEVLQFTVTDGTNSVVGFHTVIVSNLDVSAPAVSGTFPTTYVAGVGSNLTIGIVGATDASGSAYVTDDSNQLIVRLTGLPSYGTATTDGSSITYVSNSSALTTIDDEIKFEIFDGSNTTSEITIAINIVSANTGSCDPTAISLDDPSLNEGCTITPTGYRIPVFLFGLCTSEPTEPTTSSAYDLSNCSFFFDGTSSNDPATITFGGLNETTTFSGTLTIPDYATYTHGVLLVGTDLEMKGSLFLSGSSTPYFVTGDYTNNIQGFATDVTEQFVDDDPIQFLYETGVYSYDFSDENVSVYMVDDSDVLVSTDGAATGILAIEKFSVPQTFSETTSSVNIELGISDALIITNGTAASAPFSVGFTVQ